jgi:Polynucleotide kinase 3 phosphatase
MYVGDAAGRPKEGTAKKDFSACDLKLAINARISFATPEQFLSGSKQPRHCDRRRALLGPCPHELLPPAPATTAAGDAAATAAAATAAAAAAAATAAEVASGGSSAAAAGAADVGSSSSSSSSSGINASSVQFAAVVDLTDEVTATDSATMKATAAEITTDSTSFSAASTAAAGASSSGTAEQSQQQQQQQQQQQEIVLLVGPPAAGKSTYCERHLSQHVRVCQDELGSIAKCQKVAVQALAQGRSIVIDKTSSSVSTYFNISTMAIACLCKRSWRRLQ